MFEQLTVFGEPGAGAEDRQARQAPRCSSRSIRHRRTGWRRCCWIHLADQRERWTGRPAQPRPEAVAGNRHAAHAGPPSCCCWTNRCGMTDEETAHRRAVPEPEGPAQPDGGRGRHTLHPCHRRQARHGDPCNRRQVLAEGTIDQVRADERHRGLSGALKYYGIAACARHAGPKPLSLINCHA